MHKFSTQEKKTVMSMITRQDQINRSSLKSISRIKMEKERTKLLFCFILINITLNFMSTIQSGTIHFVSNLCDLSVWQLCICYLLFLTFCVKTVFRHQKIGHSIYAKGNTDSGKSQCIWFHYSKPVFWYYYIYFG